MPVKNYTSKVPASRSIEEIQKALVLRGASQVLYQYEQGTGKIQSLKFMLVIGENNLPFQLPAEWRLFQELLRKQGVSKWRDEEYVYRVTWRVLRDWVMAQLALYDTRMVDMPQIFLPYAVYKDGETVFQKFAQNPQVLLGQ